MIERYDVIVAGGGPSGIAAAAAACRCGAKTALIERCGILGGMLTAGQVQPILGSVAPGTMYDEVTALLRRGHEDTPLVRNRCGYEIHADPEEAKVRLLRFAAESGADIWLQTPVVDVRKAGDRVTGVVVGTEDGPKELACSVLVDATGNGFAAARAGAAYRVGREGDGRCQPATIEFLVDHVDEARAISCFGGSDPVLLPDGRKYAEVCKAAAAAGELPANVTIVRLHRSFFPGERNINATQANGYETLTAAGITGAELELRGQIETIVAFLRKNVPGYEHCRVKSSGSMLGVRETRRITGLREVGDIDVETGTRCADVAVHKAWFLIDIHNPAGGGQAEGHSQPAVPYDIPYGALVPEKVDGLLTAGRCISGTHRAHASYRVMGVCLATGQAAGTAAALCAGEHVQPRELDVKKLQDALRAQGCRLTDEEE